MEQDNKEQIKQMAKEVAKLALKKALTPVRVAICSTLLTVLPYLLGGIVALVLLVSVYFGTLEQINQIFDVFDGFHENAKVVEEKIKNAVSLHGFKTDEEVEHDEETKFFKMLNVYKKVFSFDNNDISLLSQTLLYEGGGEERIYLTESSSSDVIGSDVELESGISIFFKNVFNVYQRGFFNYYAGMSQYEKANKNFFINAVALSKCKNLTDDDYDKKLQCYKGYLVAQYNIYADSLVDLGQLDSDVEEGFLVYDLSSFDGNMTGITQDTNQFISQVGNYLTRFSIANGLLGMFNNMRNQLFDAVNILRHGDLATAETSHFYYDGYITQNLKEEYKTNRNDDYDSGVLETIKASFNQEILKQERQNKKETADNILYLVDEYNDLTYGADSKSNSSQSVISGKVTNYETNATVEITVDGNTINISFDDYVKLIMYQLYGDEMFNVTDEQLLREMVIRARTIAYMKIGDTKLGTVTKISDDMTQLYNQYREKANSAFVKKIDKIIKNTSGLVYKDSNGNLTQTGGTIEYINKFVPPLPGNMRNYITAYFATTDSVHRTAHSGYDFGYPRGTTVSAAAGGEVIAAYNSCGYSTSASNRCGPTGYGGYGNVVVIKSYDSNGTVYYTYYGHMDGGSVTVNVGDKVNPGQEIGKVGSSGSSTGPHLHFEVRYGCETKSCLTDPLKFFGF